MRLLGRGWQQSLIGAYEKPPAMPEDIFLLIFQDENTESRKEIGLNDGPNLSRLAVAQKVSMPVQPALESDYHAEQTVQAPGDYLHILPAEFSSLH